MSKLLPVHVGLGRRLAERQRFVRHPADGELPGVDLLVVDLPVELTRQAEVGDLSPQLVVEQTVPGRQVAVDAALQGDEPCMEGACMGWVARR